MIDAKQDNSRPGNWFSLYSAAVYTNEVNTPAHTNEPFGWVTDTGNKFERGRLARAVWPNDGERFSFFDLEGDAIQGQDTSRLGPLSPQALSKPPRTLGELVTQ